MYLQDEASGKLPSLTLLLLVQDIHGATQYTRETLLREGFMLEAMQNQFQISGAKRKVMVFNTIKTKPDLNILAL